MKQLSDQEAIKLVKTLETVWAIDDYYWYPLYDSKRLDVIAFNYHNFDNLEKITQIKQYLLDNNRTEILEMHEDRTLYWIETNAFAPFADGYHVEKFWFDKEFDWIIYVSHEGSITFGGNEFIRALKEKWPDWASYLFTSQQP